MFLLFAVKSVTVVDRLYFLVRQHVTHTRAHKSSKQYVRVTLKYARITTNFSDERTNEKMIKYRPLCPPHTYSCRIVSRKLLRRPDGSIHEDVLLL